MTSPNEPWWKHLKRIDVATLVVAVIALSFSWRATNISQSALEASTNPDVIILDAREEWFGKGQEHFTDDDAVCKHRIRITNLSSASTAIVNFDVIIQMQTASLYLSGTGEGLAVSAPGNESALIPGIGSFSASLVDPAAAPLLEWGEDYPAMWSKRLPIPIDSFQTADYFYQIQFSYNPDSFSISPSTYPSDFPPPNDWFVTKSQAGYHPISASYVLYFATGQTASSDPIPCYFTNEILSS